jgi:hypothetical protein
LALCSGGIATQFAGATLLPLRALDGVGNIRPVDPPAGAGFGVTRLDQRRDSLCRATTVRLLPARRLAVQGFGPPTEADAAHTAVEELIHGRHATVIRNVTDRIGAAQ